MMTCSNVTINILINRWFFRNTGVLFGFIFTVSSIGGTLFNLLIGNVIEDCGYRDAYRLTGALRLCCWLFFFSPCETANRGGNRTSDDVLEEGLLLRDACRTAVFRLSLAGMVVIGAVITPVLSTIAANIVDQGYPLVFAASMLSLFYVANAALKVPLGILADRLGLKWAFTLALIPLLAAVLLLSDLKPSCFVPLRRFWPGRA
jgi:MFS family permease